jgi:hypothetical protein
MLRNVFLSLIFVLGAGFAPAATDNAVNVRLIEQRTVLVSASSESEARVRASQQNAGWTVQTAKKVGDRLYEVTLTK